MTTLDLLGRHLWRSLRHRLAPTAAAVLLFAVGIGGCTLLLSLYDAIVWRTLPVPSPDELVSVRLLSVAPQGSHVDSGRFSRTDFEALRDAVAGRATLAAYAMGESVLAGDGQVTRVATQWVDDGYFRVLGVAPRLGHLFAPGDDPVRGGAGGIVLHHRTWTRRFGGDPSIVGRTVELDGRTRLVVGVAPQGLDGFQVGEAPDLWALAAEAPDRWAFFRLLGRRRPGVGSVELQATLSGVLTGLRAARPDESRFVIVDGQSSVATERIEVVDGSRGESRLRGRASQALLLVGGMSLLVLLALSANLANLLAVRALAERGTATILLALGAPRSLLTLAWFGEGLLLAGSGATLGTLFAAAIGPESLPAGLLPAWLLAVPWGLGRKALWAAAAMAIFCALLVSSLAAWEHARGSTAARLRDEGPTTTTSHSGQRWRQALIAAQVALSVVLLVAMALLGRSVGSLLAVDTGFPLDQVLTLRLDYPPEAGLALSDLARLRDELAALPGVVAAGLSRNPLLTGVQGFVLTEIEGYRAPDGQPTMVDTVSISHGFLETVGLQPVSGRPYRPLDTLGSERGVVVNRQFVEQYLPDGAPLGRRLFLGFRGAPWTRPDPADLPIIGIVEDRLVADVRERPRPRIYPLLDSAGTTITIYLRMAGSPRSLASAAARRIRQLLPAVAVGEPQTLEQRRDGSLGRERWIRDLATAFGVAATGFSALGLFAVLSYSVGQRRSELGVRLALGARPGELLRDTLRRGMRPVAWGLAAGLAIALATSGIARGFLFGVASTDPLSYGLALLSIAGVGVLAALPAALDAARVDPATTLRSR